MKIKYVTKEESEKLFIDSYEAKREWLSNDIPKDVIGQIGNELIVIKNDNEN